MFRKSWFDPNKSILVLGDSHTYGVGHTTGDLDPYRNPPSQTAWPNYVFSDEEMNNMAHPGCSNDDLSMSIFENWTPNVEVVMALFTYRNRRKVTFENKTYSFLPDQFVSVCNNHIEDQIAQNLLVNNKIEFETIKKSLILQHTDASDQINLLQNILHIQNFCKVKNCKFYWSVIHNYFDKVIDADKVTLWQIDVLQKQVNFQNCFFIDGKGMGTIFAGPDYETHTGHIKQEYHKTWGIAFKDFINTKI